MATIRSINGNPIGADPSTFEDKSIDGSKLKDRGVTPSKLAFSPNSIVRITKKGLNAGFFEKGAMDAGQDDTYRQANRCRSSQIWYLEEGLAISNLASGNAKLLVAYYNSDGSYITSSAWRDAIELKAGSFVRVMLTTSNSGTATETSVADILASFRIETPWNDTGDLAGSKYVYGLVDTNINTVTAWNHNRLVPTSLQETNNGLMMVKVPDGYKVIVYGYDEDRAFSALVLGATWLTGTNWVDMAGYPFIKILLSKSDNTEFDSETPPEGLVVTSVHEFGGHLDRHAMVSVAKDGINNDVQDYAPKYPSSSLVSFQKAYEQGFEALMLHVQFTTDGVPVVLHNEAINNVARNANGSTIGSTVKVRESTLAQLDAYDFGILYGQAYAGTKITRLADALAFAKAHGMRVVIEPTVTLTTAQDAEVCDMLADYGMAHNCGYFSYYTSVLSAVAARLPDAWLVYWPSDGDIPSHLTELAACKTATNRVFVYSQALDAETRATMRAAGIESCTQLMTNAGREPESILERVEDYPWVAVVVSQVVPADIAVAMFGE